MREKLSHPPVNEVIIGTYFNPPLLDIYAHHVGLLWQALRTRYPRIEQREPLNNMFVEAPNELWPMPRFWLTSADESHLVQLQRNALILNWRRRNSDYPSFEPVKAEFDLVYEAFVAFVRTINPEAPVQIERAELAYVNMVEQCDYWKSAVDTQTVIPSYVQLAGSTPNGFVVQQSAAVDPTTSITTGVRVGNRVQDNIPVLNFDVRVAGLLGNAPKETADAWFDKAHELTGKTFRAITNPDVRQRYWNRGVGNAN
jgi:uncharacterized protein (TIGR04255 family)